MTKLLATAAMLAALCTPALADYSLPSIPKKFQGVWLEANAKDCPTFITANTVSFCNPNNKLKLVSVVPHDEELNTVVVTWLAPAPIKMVYKLINSGGRQALVTVNAEYPALGIELFWKK
jgi:hypothetical protein